MKEWYEVIMTVDGHSNRFSLFETVEQANEYASMLALRSDMPWKKLWTGNKEDYYKSNDEERSGEIKVLKDKNID